MTPTGRGRAERPTALMAGLLTVVGILVARGLLDVEVLTRLITSRQPTADSPV